jgi:hypothetical protein
MPTEQKPQAETQSGKDLNHRFVFLSASFPSIERAPEYYETADPDEISQAVVAVVRAVLAANGRLVFGGHPTISPLVLMVAEEYLPSDMSERRRLAETHQLPVVVYQSRVFENRLPESTRRLFEWCLGELRWTPSADDAPQFTSSSTLVLGSANASLAIMRKRMLEDCRPIGAFFVAGMEGIESEARACIEIDPACRLFFFGAPGGAARKLAHGGLGQTLEPFAQFTQELQESRSYTGLTQRLIRVLSDG